MSWLHLSEEKYCRIATIQIRMRTIDVANQTDVKSEWRHMTNINKKGDVKYISQISMFSIRFCVFILFQCVIKIVAAVCNLWPSQLTVNKQVIIIVIIIIAVIIITIFIIIIIINITIYSMLTIKSQYFTTLLKEKKSRWIFVSRKNGR